jgi:hypothetical protein
MKTDPFNWIDSLVAPIPLVGQIWADALYTAIGLADALNLQHFNGENAPVPTAENIVALRAAATPAQATLREAA